MTGGGGGGGKWGGGEARGVGRVVKGREGGRKGGRREGVEVMGRGYVNELPLLVWKLSMITSQSVTPQHGRVCDVKGVH